MHPAGVSQGPDVPVQGVPGTRELSPVLASNSSPQLQHGGTSRAWPLEMLLIPHLHGNALPGGFTPRIESMTPRLVKRLQPKDLHHVPVVQQGITQGCSRGMSPGSPPSPKGGPGGEGCCSLCPAGPASLTQQLTPCVNARQLLPQAAVCSACTALFVFQGITMEGDGLSAASKWGKAAPDTCPKDPPALPLLQPLPRASAGCSVAATHQQDPN